MKRKILYITGTRADYGLMRPVLKCILQHPHLSLEIAVTGMHLMDEFGTTIDEIKSDGFPFFTIDATIDHDTKEAMVYFIGEFSPCNRDQFGNEFFRESFFSESCSS